MRQGVENHDKRSEIRICNTALTDDEEEGKAKKRKGSKFFEIQNPTDQF